MRIATYNIWNSEIGIPERTQGLLDQIRAVDADILCLQEVREAEYFEQILEESGYPYSCFFNHTYEREGLAILSKYPIKVKHYISRSIIAIIDCGEHRLAIANIHLDWDSLLKKEKEIIEIVKYLQYMNAEYVIAAGDFNCSTDSGIHRFLLGHQTIQNEEAVPYWYDLAEAYSHTTGTAPEITVDFRNNPRWKGENTIESNQRFDRIMLRNPYPTELPQLLLCQTFGQETDELSGFAPSDHWGVFADLVFSWEGEESSDEPDTPDEPDSSEESDTPDDLDSSDEPDTPDEPDSLDDSDSPDDLESSDNAD